jgi:hypothetical protein
MKDAIIEEFLTTQLVPRNVPYSMTFVCLLQLLCSGLFEKESRFVAYIQATSAYIETIVFMFHHCGLTM